LGILSYFQKLKPFFDPPQILRAFVIGAAGIGLAFLWGFAAQGQQEEVSNRVVIDVAGDVLPESSWKGSQDVVHILDGVRDEFSRADLVFLNLEEPITSSHTVTRSKKPAEVRAGRDYILHASNPVIPGILKESGVGLVGLANNHMMDYTITGLRDTLGAFREAQLPVVGAGLKQDAERAFILNAHGIRVALLAFTDVVPTNYEATEARLGVASSKDESVLVDALRRARAQADYVVLMMHWGGQGGHLVTPRQRELARVIAEAGCDVVVGMHPHVLQGIEYFGKVPVFYSIGNFAFPSGRPDARESMIVRLTFGTQGFESAEITPAQISSEGAPHIATGSEGQGILSHLDGFCRMFNTHVEEGGLARSPVRAKLVYDSAKPSRRRGAKAARRRHHLPGSG
jgi:poly-gamma-glutamate capsule biosynthesis protein CapA/YwtB (metallophosphatase superfamily)